MYFYTLVRSTSGHKYKKKLDFIKVNKGSSFLCKWSHYVTEAKKQIWSSPGKFTSKQKIKIKLFLIAVSLVKLHLNNFKQRENGY